jgi:hypothetical protein
VEQRRIDLLPDLEPEVVTEVGRRSAHEVAFGGGGVGVPALVDDEQPDAGERVQQRLQAVGGDPGGPGQVPDRALPGLHPAEQVDPESGEQRLGGHEAVREVRQRDAVLDRCHAAAGVRGGPVRRRGAPRSSLDRRISHLVLPVRVRHPSPRWCSADRRRPFGRREIHWSGPA